MPHRGAARGSFDLLPLHVGRTRSDGGSRTLAWIEGAGLGWDGTDLAAFRGGAAAALVFHGRGRTARPLADRWCRMELADPRPVWLFPHGTLDLPEAVHRGLLTRYLAAGGDRAGSYRAFIARVLAEGVTRGAH